MRFGWLRAKLLELSITKAFDWIVTNTLGTSQLKWNFSTHEGFIDELHLMKITRQILQHTLYIQIIYEKLLHLQLLHLILIAHPTNNQMCTFINKKEK